MGEAAMEGWYYMPSALAIYTWVPLAMYEGGRKDDGGILGGSRSCLASR